MALHACVEAITEGHHVMYIDLEDHPSSVFARMLTLGADKEDVRARFHYVNPENPMGIDDWDVIERNIKRDNIAIVVIDSIGELLSVIERSAARIRGTSTSPRAGASRAPTARR